MQSHDAFNAANALLKPESRFAMLLAIATMITGAGSCVESTLELTNRVYDRYLPMDRAKTAA